MSDKRFVIRAFDQLAKAEAWLNTLPAHFEFRACTDTNACFTVVVENTEAAIARLEAMADDDVGAAA